MEAEVRKAFLDRPRLVEGTPGFRGLDVLTDAKDSSVFLLLTRWTDAESFRAWHRSEAHHESHRLIPKGLKLDASFTSVTVAESFKSPENGRDLNEALEVQATALSQWLIGSEAVFALLLEPDGTIRARNRAAERIFPTGPGGEGASEIWHYLISADIKNLRCRLAAKDRPEDGSFLLNLADGERSPVTWDVQLIRCTGFFLLLGTQESRHDSVFQTEILKLTNELSAALRESSRVNRQLQKTNETIESLVRTDALTGLANRRMLEEALPRETARAERLRESLSVIFADLDRFKSINDEFGHKTGDKVLQGFGAVVKSQMRAYALAARFGGDEFVLLLPGTTVKGAVTLAKRIRKKVAELTVPGCPRQIAVSMGIASFGPGETGEELVARADAALYRAKEKGRNRIEIAQGPRTAGAIGA